MQIQNSNILLSSQHQTAERTEVKASLNFWSGDAGQPATASALALDKVTLSTQSRQLASSQQTNGASATGDATTDQQQQMLTALVERITGEKIKIFSAQDTGSTPPLPDPARAGQTLPQRGAGYGLAYDYHETRYQSEQTTLSAQGVIKTADGKEIHFSLDLEMSHEYLEQTDVSIRASGTRQVKEPLVINFGGLAAQLNNTRFAFDIDTDGKADRASFPKSGSGFLALGKNSDGAINNGTGLFSAGNGFREPVGYDEGRHGFIDGKNSVFPQLRVLTGDTQRRNLLNALTEKGIGSINPGSAAAPFNHADPRNATDGQLKSSGTYAKEDSSAGNVQQIDLSV